MDVSLWSHSTDEPLTHTGRALCTLTYADLKPCIRHFCDIRKDCAVRILQTMHTHTHTHFFLERVICEMEK